MRLWAKHCIIIIFRRRFNYVGFNSLVYSYYRALCLHSAMVVVACYDWLFSVGRTFEKALNMAKYVIKNNLPEKDGACPNFKFESAKEARKRFMEIAKNLAVDDMIKVTFRSKPLRGTIQVEIDGFYYYVELYKEG